MAIGAVRAWSRRVTRDARRERLSAGRGAGLMLAGCAHCPRTMLNALLLCCGLLALHRD